MGWRNYSGWPGSEWTGDYREGRYRPQLSPGSRPVDMGSHFEVSAASIAMRGLEVTEVGTPWLPGVTGAARRFAVQYTQGYSGHLRLGEGLDRVCPGGVRDCSSSSRQRSSPMLWSQLSRITSRPTAPVFSGDGSDEGLYAGRMGSRKSVCHPRPAPWIPAND